MSREYVFDDNNLIVSLLFYSLITSIVGYIFFQLSWNPILAIPTTFVIFNIFVKKIIFDELTTEVYSFFGIKYKFKNNKYMFHNYFPKAGRCVFVFRKLCLPFIFEATNISEEEDAGLIDGFENMKVAKTKKKYC